MKYYKSIDHLAQVIFDNDISRDYYYNENKISEGYLIDIEEKISLEKIKEVVRAIGKEESICQYGLTMVSVGFGKGDIPFFVPRRYVIEDDVPEETKKYISILYYHDEYTLPEGVVNYFVFIDTGEIFCIDIYLMGMYVRMKFDILENNEIPSILSKPTILDSSVYEYESEGIINRSVFE